MRVVEDFPREVRVIENVWIPMSDGCRLAARIWLPVDAEQRPVPAVLEYMPYRKRDFTRLRDEPLHSYMAGYGYASIRLDLRGTGDSEGLLRDEYLPQEQDDAVEAIAWIAAQPWCSGEVGMFGISWGGFNALQVAARRPPALKAIITMCSTDDRYADDAHYKGGCLLTENQNWGSAFLNVAAMPPDPEIVGAQWREQWRQRLDEAVLYPAVWLGHPHRDDYWRQGSICEDYAAIECPVYAVGGWADGYTNAVPRMMEGLQCPRKALIGPWAHVFPHDAAPGPSIGFFQECVRWWDRWLKGRSNGIDREPRYRVWMEEWHEPYPTHGERRGRWVAEDHWPSPNIAYRRWYLNVNALGVTPDAEDAVRVCSPQTTGLVAGDWYGFGAEGEAPADQREDDGKSLVFDSDPVTERLELLGAPVVTLDFSSDQPVAAVFVRLNDVAPDGTSTRVCYGVLNLTHRESHEAPSALVSGKRYRVPVQLNDMAYAFEPGHTMRIAVSTAYWPLVWPTPAPVTLTVHTGTSRLDLPIRPPRPEDEDLREFPPPEKGPTSEHTPLAMADVQRSIRRDLTTNETVYTVHSDAGDFSGAALARIEDIDLTVGYTMTRTYRIGEDDPLSASMTIEQKTSLGRGDWQTRMHLITELRADTENFHLKARLVAHEGDELFVERQWDEAIPRRLV